MPKHYLLQVAKMPHIRILCMFTENGIKDTWYNMPAFIKIS